MFNLPEEYNQEIKKAIEQEFVPLPFDAPFLWWMNGNAREKKTGGPPYFGGWAAHGEEFDNVLAAMGRNIPPTFKEYEMVNSQGSSYRIYAARAVSVAVIGSRKRWRKDAITGKSRSNLQVLAYMALYKGGKYEPWGPVVLSTKGLSAKGLEDALNLWAKETAKARRQFADNLPAWWFYVPLGTFDKEPQVKMVGPQGNQSPITPIQVYFLSQTIDQDVLHSWFVGQEIAATMIDLRRRAQEWLDDWKGKQYDQDIQPVVEEDNNIGF